MKREYITSQLPKPSIMCLLPIKTFSLLPYRNTIIIILTFIVIISLSLQCCQISIPKKCSLILPVQNLCKYHVQTFVSCLFHSTLFYGRNHAVSCSCSLFIFIPVQYSNVLICHNLFIHSIVVGYVGLIPVWADYE